MNIRFTLYIVVSYMFCSCVSKMPSVRDNIKQENPFGNALIPDMVADASIIDVDGTFYCYATTDGYGQGLLSSGPPTVWKSKDFVNWSFNGTYFPQAAEALYWAPSKAIEHAGKWYIYPTINHQIFPGVADSPEGPFRLLRGNEFTEENNFLSLKEGYIDGEVFKDDDGKYYLFWGNHFMAHMKEDMSAPADSIHRFNTRIHEYSEGPIFFKRKGIYYYLYTRSGHENYEYYYMLSHVSPYGPWETPKQDCISSTNIEHGVFGPGHGNVFNVEGTDDWYFAFLEFGRAHTNRQTYVNRLEFNEDGTIRPVEVTLKGVGALHEVPERKEILPVSVSASSVHSDDYPPSILDERCKRTEHFCPEFALDAQNGSRWMADEDDEDACLSVDFGKRRKIGSSELYFVQPTAGHSYRLEASYDAKSWTTIAEHLVVEKCSPHIDIINDRYRYLRVSVLKGAKGLWEWKFYE